MNKHDMVFTSNGFSEKIIFQGKQAILGLKMVHPHNFGSSQRIFLRFCAMRWGKSYIEIILKVFLKKNSFRANGPF